MMLKKTKKEVIEDIRNAAFAAATQAGNINLTVDSYQLQNAIKLNGQYGIQDAIASAVAAGFAKLIENTYFEAEFEEDIGLKPIV